MFDSPTPIRSTLVENPTPSSLQENNNPTSSASKPLNHPAKPQGEENQQHIHNYQSSELVLNKSEQSSGSGKKEMKTNKNTAEDDATSDCGTEISVAARRDWLKKFEQQHQSNPFRTSTASSAYRGHITQSRDDDQGHDPRVSKSNIAKPPKTPDKNAVTLMNRLTQTSSMKVASPHRTVTAPRASNQCAISVMKRTSIASSSSTSAATTKPTFATPTRKSTSTRPKEHVMATDEGYASVKELSQWLASDPTSTKKMKQVRRGRNVILKSRHYEKDLANVVMIENNISKGAVKDRQKWLSNAFHKEHDDDAASSVVSNSSRYYAKSEIAGGTGSYSFHNRFHSRAAKTTAAVNAICDSQSEIITDDAASSLSVADKKDWLKNAFSGKATATMVSHSPAKARTDVMYDRRPCHEDMASRAKMRFKERSARKLLDKPSTEFSPKTNDSSVAPPDGKGTVNVISTDNQTSVPDSKVSFVDEDTAPVDFRAAREALVQRSKKNGNRVDVVNKVYLRKKKFEKIEEENRRMSCAQGLIMKPSWDHANPLKGFPSDSFEKKLVSDIAPKKSFEELP
jgi:hypothetical protein